MVAEGHVAEGVELVRGLPRAEARLECWAYYRHWINGEHRRDEYRRSADAYRAVVMLNPNNTRAAGMYKDAKQRSRTQ